VAREWPGSRPQEDEACRPSLTNGRHDDGPAAAAAAARASDDELQTEK